ncbi:phosphoglycerate kinase [bacterium]|nr:phosphoglycerate kinase [bacterium]
MNKLTIDKIDVNGKRVLLRVDFNVPLDDKGTITDDTRIRESLPTIQKIITAGGKPVIMSHLGRPKGKKNPSMSLKPVGVRLSELLGIPVVMAEDCVGEVVEKQTTALKPGEAMLLENLRYYNEEEANDDVFCQKLSKLGDVYVNDAFGTAHRAHASTAGITKHFRQNAAGYLMEKEIEYLGSAVQNPKRPFVAIIGGAKISGKIDVIENLMKKVDTVLVGGGMSFTFAKVMGYEIGASLFEADKADMARDIIERAKSSEARILFPSDCVVAKEFKNETEFRTVPINAIPEGWMGLDIGAATVETYREEILSAGMVVWNGPMGVFEMPNFAAGTRAVAEILAEATKKGCTTIVGGGDSAAAVTEMGFEDKVTHVSTGGGASLEYLEGKKLPGLEALTNC